MLHKAPIYLFFDQDDEVKRRKLADAAHRLRRGDIDRKKASAMGLLREKIKRARFIPQHRGSSDLLNEIFESEGVKLDDGYLRLVLVNKWGYLEIWNGERFASHHYGHLSPTARMSKEMIRLKAGTETFPWKNPWYHEAVITRVEWVEDLKFYKVFIPIKGVTQKTAERRGLGVTHYFLPRYEEARLGKEWKQPRARYSSTIVPISPSS